MNTWQLPEGVDELTGDRALVFERVRRQLIDLYTDKGFGLVIPPMVENIESLLLTSESVNKKTFKFLDPSSGKMLGVHADITPQIARIDAKQGSDKISKYCYVNAILQTKADDFYTSRSPIQAGAELYGSNSIDADIEVIVLMLESLKLLAIEPIVLSLGNVAVFDALIAQEALNDEQIPALRQIFVKRSAPDLAVFLSNNTLKNADKFSALMKLEGDASVLDEALTLFKDIPKAKAAVQDLVQINANLSTAGVEIVIDLGELKAYEYHTGVVFCAYNENYSKALAQGGRYNGLSASFGRPRAATGFSFDLKFLTH
ncbi:ATP phosphoribosyltransferase regulatory subunit (EC 2.4.2.17) [uncultured Gammaproteobacteria bacterium]|jgi:ATP phosphoribosyltransferase regulatory subunit|uniref:ATP phosphoribosyltransferase regulatory subunit n=1 Tax=thiotrophic endosymbiont of Bathymodiolus puteoserpentis (Logatchev) TaxID=343240 RepID=UPI0010B21505|nr:ATP phosphoribosyltransferase regulatory subunit [thiotrophic endosymbiont of Bathymodiolus puteoserpentis (Logatchev)]CAC9570446.1 ATP phosphoribosyltransferase regulatory subunit (EC 2.4.2.17) [uncultured Gammaproteobacteria bacterium]CAC9570762.1 ATP phosphoribosyltransferase regulatory subunit (EC 2.4.2.17) [uncultured Gammaproteobacteria bacterium]CAC9953064.1 ATP phosphoribosyltransferase regulatory subunit (EC 2.4.2.17) [uncultured Gammaproteobacteria bacterium]CAC9978929.1 ATP phosph